MDDFAGHLRKASRITLFFLSFCLVAWALGPTAFKPYIGGLIVGVIISITNGLYLAWKVNRVGQLAVDHVKKRVGLGFFTRGCLAVLGAIIAQRLELSLIATVAGLFFFQLATLLLGLLSMRQKPQ
jgi:ATP synthase protein I